MIEVYDYDDKNVTIPGALVTRETDKALLVEVEGEQLWIPKSQVHDDSDVYQDGDHGDLVISRWIAEQKELV